MQRTRPPAICIPNELVLLAGAVVIDCLPAGPVIEQHVPYLVIAEHIPNAVSGHDEGGIYQRLQSQENDLWLCSAANAGRHVVANGPVQQCGVGWAV